MLRLIKRHLKACAKAAETDFDCQPKLEPSQKRSSGNKVVKPRCPFHIIGPHPLNRGKVFKESTETSDIRVAQAKLLQRETQFFMEPDKVPKRASKTLTEAVIAFENTKKDTSKARQRKFRRVLGAMIKFLEDRHGSDPRITVVEKTDLDELVSSWSGALSTRKGNRENLKQFWLYCTDSDFIPKNIAARLKTIGTKRDEEQAKNKPIPTFSPEEVTAFDLALDRCDEIFLREKFQDTNAPKKTRAFMYVMKFSGLAIVDVVTLRPNDFMPITNAQGSIAINKQRWKTGKIAHTAVPRFVWKLLQDFPPESEYFFWSGRGDPQSRVDTFRDRMKKLSVAAEIRVFDKTARKKSGGRAKASPETFDHSHAVPHMWRHTLVRDLYIKNIPVRRIADILGDDPETVTKYYSQFDSLRQRQTMETMDDLHLSDPVAQRHTASGNMGRNTRS